MATAGQLHARQLTIVEVVVIITSRIGTKYSKPISVPFFFFSLPSALESGERTSCCRRRDTSSAEPVRHHRQWSCRRAIHLAHPLPARQEFVHRTTTSRPCVVEETSGSNPPFRPHCRARAPVRARCMDPLAAQGLLRCSI